MSKARGTRSFTSKAAEGGPSKTATTKVLALRKIFFVCKSLLEDPTQQLHLERFFHPGKGRLALFMTRGDQDIMEVLEFGDARRSWLIDSEVCSNGCVYMTTPIDVTFLVLHHLRKYCVEKALALDNIGAAEDSNTLRLLARFVRTEQLECVSDVKKAGDIFFYKYNEEKTLAWLTLKVRLLATTLLNSGVHCGHSALSQNYVRSERAETDESSVNYLRMACDIVGDYIDLDLHEKLKQHLEIPPETLVAGSKEDEKKKQAGKKRKSLQLLSASDNKKLKMDAKAEGAVAQLQNSSILDEPLDKDSDDTGSGSGDVSPTELVQIVMSPKKERSLTAKEKALAKSAKGTKSIASFFKK